MKLFGIIDNTLIFESLYSIPEIYIDVSDEDKAELLAHGAMEFSDLTFVNSIPYCIRMNAWESEYDKLKYKVSLNGDWHVLRILYDKIEGEKEPWDTNIKRGLYHKSIEEANSPSLPDEWGKDELPF